ncbi:hypothetical protein PTSG_02720 [Salpingoeca rosetta]|uniref:Uncharacterized protein n=1 Tax=Salpingoeca rosetta (strain ATCC 50818 / BSB-021) TaxID=946362 RepID=F2U339_SALR5|nr:uncharacterized protein PTSG_02720 [Salpingoeca rosetta]EGD82033.1 hypothetical protein PTSG_02720 [Salpingoeca rosetta]|eukprot:XP_004996216.1 hypothetical protein PTSG_02720 [Salpingoeca rosetta]
MDEAMITGQIKSRLVSKGVDDIVIWAAPWCMVFEATHVGSEDAQLSKAPIQQDKLAGRFVSGIVLLLAVLNKTGTLTVGSPQVMRLWRTAALYPATDLKTVSGRSISATVDSKPIAIGMPIRQTMHEDEETRGYMVVVCSADGKLLPGLRLVSLTRASPRGEEGGAPAAPACLTMAMLTGDKEGTARSIGDRGWHRHRARSSVQEMEAKGRGGGDAIHWSWQVATSSATPTTDVHAIREITSVHVSEIQSMATAATSAPSVVVLWHHFDEGDGLIGTISVPASGEQHLLVSEGRQFWRPRSIRGNGSVHQPRDGERVLTTYILEQWSMTFVAVVLWSMRGWQPITQHNAGQCKLRVSHLDTRRQARSPVWPSFAVPAAFAELERAVRMFHVTVSTAVEDAKTDTPLSLLSFAANKASHAPALRAIFSTSTSVSWLDYSMVHCVVDKVCEAIRAFNQGGQQALAAKPWSQRASLTHTLVADIILLVCTFPSELELATSTADKQYNHQQRA